jgi:hypothetical protein
MVIAERIVYYTDVQGVEQEMLVQVHLPQQEENAWKCTYSIGAPYARESSAYGADAAQALSLALVKVGLDLTHPPPRLRGKLLNDTPNFGFPVLPKDNELQAA